MDRRGFVKGCMGAAGAGALAAAGFGVGRALTTPGTSIGVLRTYVGAKKTGGPAPRGVPLIPVRVDAEGRVGGATKLEGTRVLPWYRYCGHERAPGLHAEYAGDDRFRYFLPSEKANQGFTPWYRHLLGKEARAADFPEPGFGAAVSWRSEGAAGADVVTGVLIRVGTDPEDSAGLGRTLAFEGVDARLQEALLAQVRSTGFLAFSTYCTHFCCVPGWKEDETARTKDAWDEIYCSCHFSRYDPFTLVRGQFIEEIPVDPDTGEPAWE